jgi:tetratricopeptide (TPR) repeat protein
MKKMLKTLLIALLITSSIGCVTQVLKSEVLKSEVVPYSGTNKDVADLKLAWNLQSIGHYQELAASIESRFKDISSVNILQLSDLCKAYSRLKKYNKLFACLDEVERRYGKKYFSTYSGSSHPSDMILLRTEALLDLGKYQEAIEQTTKTWEQQWDRLVHVGTQNIVSVLALAHALNGDRAQAETFSSQMEGIKVPESTRESTWKYGEKFLFLGIARTNVVLGDFRKCLIFTRKIGSFIGTESQILFTTIRVETTFRGEKVGLDKELPLLFLKSKCAFETGQVEEAKAGYDELLNFPQILDVGGIHWISLLDRGKIAEAEGNLGEAIDFYQRAIEVIEQQRSTINTETSKIGYVGDKQQVYHRMVVALVTDRQPAKAFEYVERSKARALVDLLSSKQDFASGDHRPTTSSIPHAGSEQPG